MSGCREIRRRRQDEILSNCGVDFNELPEGCIAAIISLTSPHDASRYALVSKLFQSVADSDVVWKSFLPSDYQVIIARCSNSAEGLEINILYYSLSKKQLFLRLADEPLLIDDGSKSFALDKRSGNKIYMLAARSLYIEWGNDIRYWAWAHTQDSRFQEVAHLRAMCWLELRGNIKISLLSQYKKYVTYLVFKMKDNNCGFDCSIEASMKIGGTINTRNISMYTQEEEDNRGYVIHLVEGCPEQRPDGWSELKIGEFFIHGEEDGDVEMALMEVNVGH